MSDHILTYSKIKFYPLDPIECDIHIEDIAHSLSLMTRANGHFERFYSVAQHSVNCCREARAQGYSERIQLGCLLHDASESYISDLTRPVKRFIPEYSAVEEKLQQVIYRRFGLGDLTWEEIQAIAEVDNLLLYLEFKYLMGEEIGDHALHTVIAHDFSQRDFVSVEKEFLACFRRLKGADAGGQAEGLFVGIDGCKGGWAVISITEDIFDAGIYKTIAEICSVYHCAENILIGMPIGLPQGTNDLRPDNPAKKMLKSKASSIFDAPCRQAVYAGSYQESNEINRRALGKGLSAYAYAICGKIREIDVFLHTHPQYKNKLWESHPELCFAVLNGGAPVLESKKTEAGRKRRIELLSRYYKQTEEVMKYATDHPKLSSILDDVVDAFCLAVSGRLIREKGMMRIPERPMTDDEGITMQMVYPGV